MNRSHRAVLAWCAVVVLLLAGCTRLPTEGPVTVETKGGGTVVDQGAMYIDPLPPQPDQSPTEVVKGFLDAMQATPIQTNTASQFLTREARAAWEPEAATLTYSLASVPRGRTTVAVTLGGVQRLDGRGAWQGAPQEAATTLEFPLVREDGEYRIAEAPDALIVPESWFEPRFRQVSLYFFEPTGQILVPDPVYVPTGPQLASTLVRRLLAGPPPELRSDLRSMLPSGVRAGLSVPVSGDGLADVRLAGEVAPTPADIEAMVAQLAWTLRQDPAIRRVRITVGDRVLQEPGGRTEFDVESGESFAPYVAGSTSLLYGLRHGVLVAGVPSDLDPVGGPFGRAPQGIRSVSVSLDASRAAAVTTTGDTLLTAPVQDGGTVVVLPVSGSNLLRPAWDFAGRLWAVDNRSGGALIHYVNGERAQSVRVPGITGADVRSFLVSRDGSRLVAVVRTAAGDRVLASRLLHAPDGSVRGALPATDIGPSESGLRIRDIDWRHPTGVTALVPLTGALAELRELTVDGSPAELSGLPVTVRGRVVGLAGSPAPEQRTYGVLADGLIDLIDSTGGAIAVPGGVRSVGYAG